MRKHGPKEKTASLSEHGLNLESCEDAKGTLPVILQRIKIRAG